MLKKKGTTPHGSSQNLSSTGGWENPIWTKPHQTSMVGFILTSLLGCVKMNPSAEASLSLPWWYSQKSCNISMYIQSQRNWHNTLYDERYCWWQAEISGDHQLRLVVYPPWFTRLKCIPGGCLGFLKHQPEHSSTSVRWEMDPGNRGDWNSKSQRLEELEGQFLSLGIQSPNVRWWLGCIIPSSARYLGFITILRRWLDPQGLMFFCWLSSTDPSHLSPCLSPVKCFSLYIWIHTEFIYTRILWCLSEKVGLHMAYKLELLTSYKSWNDPRSCWCLRRSSTSWHEQGKDLFVV